MPQQLSEPNLAPRRDSPLMRAVPPIITGVVVGAVFSLAVAGVRGSHPLLPFILISAFVAGTGVVVDRICERFMRSRE